MLMSALYWNFDSIYWEFMIVTNLTKRGKNIKKPDSHIVQEPNTFWKICCTTPLPFERVTFAFEGSYITSAVRKSMLNMPVPGSF